MSTWLVTLKWHGHKDYYNQILYEYKENTTPINRIIKFKGDLPTEKEIDGLMVQDHQDSRGVDFYIILFMQKLKEEEVKDGNDRA